MCIHNLNSVLKFCYPNNFFSGQAQNIISKKNLPTVLTSFDPNLFLIVCGRRKWQKIVIQIEQLRKKKVYFPLLSFLQITFFLLIFSSLAEEKLSLNAGGFRKT